MPNASLIGMKHPLLTYFGLALLLSVPAIAQTTDTSALYSQFDNSIGKRNLGLNNGTVHLNMLKSADKSHRYFKTDGYTTGSVTYDGQLYTNVSLKYDLLKGILIAKVDGKNNNTGINLISDKIASFSFYGKEFVNIEQERQSGTTISPSFSGFYEKDRIGKLTLFTQHRKEGIEVLQLDGVFYKFSDRQDFAVKFNGRLHQLNSQRDLIDLFPSAEESIRLFYSNNSQSEKNDTKTFYTNLLRQIDQSLP